MESLTNNSFNDFATDWYRPRKSQTLFDFDGDGKADPAIYRDGVWAIYGSTSGYIGTLWGLGSDIPLSRR